MHPTESGKKCAKSGHTVIRPFNRFEIIEDSISTFKNYISFYLHLGIFFF